MSLGSDVFGYVAGAFGTIALLYGLLVSQLPKTKIQSLEKVIRDTEDIFQNTNREGLLTNSDYVFRVEDQLVDFNNQYEELRARALCTSSFVEECVEMAKGLSRTITIICARVSKLRADILTTSQAERMRARRRNVNTPQNNLERTNTPSPSYTTRESSSRLMVQVNAEHPPKHRPRSRSCPPSGIQGVIPYPPPFLSELDERYCLLATIRASSRLDNYVAGMSPSRPNSLGASEQHSAQERSSGAKALLAKITGWSLFRRFRNSPSTGMETHELHIPDTYGPPEQYIPYMPNPRLDDSDSMV